MTAADDMTLLIGNRVYGGWTGARVTRAIDRAATDFHFEVSEKWAGQKDPWQIQPFNNGEIRIGDDPVMTGYVDAYLPSFDAEQHGVQIAGRSKTEDLIDCTPEIEGGQFNGYKLDAIARAVAAPFGVSVVVETDVGAPFPDVQLQRTETGFAFLERLCRLRGVLACDDARGNLVLTRAGSDRAAGSLVQGENIYKAHARLTANKRFSVYTVRSQHAVSEEWGDQVGTQIKAQAFDPGCPRYRPHMSMAESALDLAGAQLRARWQAVFFAARSIEAHISVRGWRQPDGRLWAINQIIPVKSAWLQLDRELLIAGVSFSISDKHGRTADLILGPVEAYTPDPGSVKLKKGKGTGDVWNDVRGIH